MVCSGAIFNYMTMTDSGVINSGHEPNSVQSLLQCPFERRTLAEKLKVKELGPDQPDGLIYREELFVELCAAPPQKNSPAATGCHWPVLVSPCLRRLLCCCRVSSCEKKPNTRIFSSIFRRSTAELREEKRDVPAQRSRSRRRHRALVLTLRRWIHPVQNQLPLTKTRTIQL